MAIHNLDHARDEEVRQLRTDLVAASAHCTQLEEANRAWQQYQHDQVEAFRQRLGPQIPALDQTENATLDFMAQQILIQLNELHIEGENLRRHIDHLKEEVQVHKQKIGNIFGTYIAIVACHATRLDRSASVESEKRPISRASQERQLREVRLTLLWLFVFDCSIF